ncbi:fumarate reductase subunit C [beta proteobacterium MWH-UniP1]
MSQQTTPRRAPYIRPMGGWWKRNPFFMAYMLRELTSVAVLAYAIVLAVGLVRLSQGPAQWQAFMDAVTSPLGVVFHCIILISMLVHTKSWFEIMPKTMPPVVISGKPIPGKTITRLGWLAAAVVFVIMMMLAKTLTT